MATWKGQLPCHQTYAAKDAGNSQGIDKNKA
jgi:hypothetical protein